jgi:hypothetical protein
MADARIARFMSDFGRHGQRHAPLDVPFAMMDAINHMHRFSDGPRTSRWRGPY